MDKDKYLSALADKLRALGVSEEDISKQLKITRNYLESLDENELGETLSDTEQLDNVASNIYSFIQKKKEKLVETQELNKVLAQTIPSSGAVLPQPQASDQPAAQAQPQPQVPVQPQLTLQTAQQNVQNAYPDLYREDQAVKSEQPSQQTQREQPRQDAPQLPDNPNQPRQPRPEIRRYNTSEFAVDHDPSSHSSSFAAVSQRQNKARRDMTSETPAVKQQSGSRDRRYDDSRYFTSAGKRRDKYGTSTGISRVDDPENDDSYGVEKAHGSPLFWILFIGTLPFTAVIYAALFIIYGALFAAFAALIVGLIAVLIADIAVGTAVSLVGIIYGITQLFNPLTRAVGLYELGLGLLIGGGAMFAGIIIYNVAIRLLPFILKKWTYLLRLILGKLKDLYYALKRRSSDSVKRGENA